MESNLFKKIVLNDDKSNDVYLFLKNVFTRYPEDKLFNSLKKQTHSNINDEQVYSVLQEELKHSQGSIKTVKLAMSCLKRHKDEFKKQFFSLLKYKKEVDGFLEFGSRGICYGMLKEKINFSDKVYFVNDKDATMAPMEMLERASIHSKGEYINIHEMFEHYNQIPDNSLDLIVCYRGLHHLAESDLDKTLLFFKNKLRVNGTLILREHDADSHEAVEFACLAHTLINLKMHQPYHNDQSEIRNFKPLSQWEHLIKNKGFSKVDKETYVDSDPSKIAFVHFIKQEEF